MLHRMIVENLVGYCIAIEWKTGPCTNVIRKTINISLINLSIVAPQDCSALLMKRFSLGCLADLTDGLTISVWKTFRFSVRHGFGFPNPIELLLLPTMLLNYPNLRFFIRVFTFLLICGNDWLDLFYTVFISLHISSFQVLELYKSILLSKSLS